jgi:hypothetical protein
MEYQPSIKELRARFQLLSSDPNPHFVLRDSDLAKVNDVAMIALTKSILFSTHTIIVTDPCSVLAPFGSPPPTAHTTWTANILHSQTARFILENQSDPLCRDSFTIAPASFSEGTEEWEDEDNWLTGGPDETISFESEYTNPSALNVNFADPVLAFQLLERAADGPPAPTIVKLWLPSLQGISPKTLLKLRADEADAFGRFHFAINEIVHGLQNSDSTTRVKEVLQKTDFEVRQYHEHLRTLKRRK